MAGERTRTRSAAKPEAPVEQPNKRQRNASAKTEPAPEPTNKRQRTSSAKTEPAAPVTKGKREVASPRRKLVLPGRNRRSPAEDSDDAVKILVQAALNANPDLDNVSSGQLNLMLMGAGLASSSADASVIWQKAVKNGVVSEA